MVETTLPGTVLDYLPFLVDRALRLDSDAYAVFQTLPGSSWVAWAVIVGAALSLAVGHSAILFLNRVRPASFVFALLAVAISLAGGLVVWLLSTWAITHWLFGVELSVGTVGRTLAFACLPLLFGFLAAMPYFGLAVFAALAFWSLLGVATGLTALSSLSFGQALMAATFGWLAWQVLERTIGRPVVAIGRQLERRAAGVELKTDVLSLAALITEETEQVGASLLETVLEEVAPESPPDGPVPHRNVPHRNVPHRTVPHRTVPGRSAPVQAEPGESATQQPLPSEPPTSEPPTSEPPTRESPTREPPTRESPTREPPSDTLDPGSSVPTGPRSGEPE